MKRKISFVILLLILLVGISGVGYKFIRHERAQNARIAALQSSLAILNTRLSDYTPADEFKAAIYAMQKNDANPVSAQLHERGGGGVF